MDRHSYHHGLSDKRNLLGATTGFGGAGALDPEGQAAFSYWQPINRHPNNSG
jgi:hypothetical protein